MENKTKKDMENKELEKNAPVELDDEVLDDVSGAGDDDYSELLRPIDVPR